jgi:NADH pyrophosphatase NudC (nudix superfamily)
MGSQQKQAFARASFFGGLEPEPMRVGLVLYSCGSDKKPGLQKKRETPTVKANESLLNHRRRTLMQVQVSLTIEIEATASISQMEQSIQEAGQQAMREALKQAVRQWEDQHSVCPHCGEKQRRLEGTTRRVIATTFGRVEVARRRFRCQGCWQRWCPANHLFAKW